jgi:lycopene cyclase domain-containing protein
VSGLLDLAPRWHYLGVLAACLICTLPLEVLGGARVYRQTRRLARTLLTVGLPFLVLDWAAVHGGLWSFSPDHTIGAVLPGGIPIEEALFFAVIPICALLTHATVTSRAWTHRRTPPQLDPPVHVDQHATDPVPNGRSHRP